MDNLWSLKGADGGEQFGSVAVDTEKTRTQPVSVTRRSDMDDSWREAGFSPSTFRHPFQLTAFSSSAIAPAAPFSPASAVSSTQSPPSMDNSSLPHTQSQSVSTSQQQHRHHHRRQSLSFLYPSRSLNPTPVSFSRRGEPGFIKNTLIPLACFIPIPLLLSLLYLILGHAVLSFHSVPIVNSLKAGVVGGAILSIPLTIILYLVFFPTPSPPPPQNTNPLDFFDDDESRNEHIGFLVSLCQCQSLLWRFALQGLIIVFIGAVTGPLGVTVLSDAEQYLTPGQAAKAGVVGGLILSPAIVGLSIAGVLVWRGQWPWRSGSEEGEEGAGAAS